MRIYLIFLVFFMQCTKKPKASPGRNSNPENGTHCPDRTAVQKTSEDLRKESDVSEKTSLGVALFLNASNPEALEKRVQECFLN
jgi:hypothetical protein